MSLNTLLETARGSISRLEPADAYAAAQAGALIVDIRSDEARKRGGVVPGALHVPRTVLEWRVAPDSDWRNPELADRLILICDHGYSSLLAAAALVELGLDATDVVGGFEAWRASGLPVPRARSRRRNVLPGMGPRD